MLKIENVVLPSSEQWIAIIRGMRNPKNSWFRSDSHAVIDGEYFTPFGDIGLSDEDDGFYLGEENDRQLAMTLASGGPVHGKFRRMIPVYLDITAPLYWWKEFDTYKVGTVANSCSTMHKIHAKELMLDDFSHEHLLTYKQDIQYTRDKKDLALAIEDENVVKLYDSEHVLILVIAALNHFRELYLETKDKKYWWQMIQLLPSSYNQKRTVMLNYEVLSNIYQYRRHHKLDEWHTLCNWIETLPYAELIFANLDLEDEK